MKKLLIHPEELSKVWVDRLAAQGVEVLGLHPVGGNGAVKSAEKLMQQVEDPAFQALVDYAWEKGLQVEYELHAASYLLPRELFQTHPEYFREEAGQRTPLVNFCVSNAEALEIFTDNAVEMAKKLYRSRPYYYFWLDDTKAKCCTCPKCRSLSMSDQQMPVVNAMAAKLRKAIPGTKLCFLAYHGTETPPWHSGAQPRRGRRNPGSWGRIPGTRPRPACTLWADIAKLMEVFGKEDATVLEYWYDNSMYSKWTKPSKAFVPRNDLIPGDLRWYESLGFENIASFACYLGEDYVNLHGEPDISAFR